MISYVEDLADVRKLVLFLFQYVLQTVYGYKLLFIGYDLCHGRLRLFTWPTYQPTWASMQLSHLYKMHHCINLWIQAHWSLWLVMWWWEQRILRVPAITPYSCVCANVCKGKVSRMQTKVDKGTGRKTGVLRMLDDPLGDLDPNSWVNHSIRPPSCDLLSGFLCPPLATHVYGYTPYVGNTRYSDYVHEVHVHI